MTGVRPQTRLLFVCLGNICRSPMARWIMEDLCRRRGVSGQFLIDSCGTGGWHAGEAADGRSAQCAMGHGLGTAHVARQITQSDLQTFDMILVMDRSNLRDVLHLGAARGKVHLLRAFDPQLADADDRDREVPDPYYGGDAGFEQMYQMLHRACDALLSTLLAAQAGITGPSAGGLDPRCTS